MRLTRFNLALAAAIAVGAHGGTAVTRTNTAPDSAKQRSWSHVPGDSALQSLLAFGDSFRDTRATVMSRMGHPLRTTPRLLGNGDTMIDLEYAGATFTVWRGTVPLAENLLEVRVWRPMPGLHPVVLGATSIAQVRSLLGPTYYKEQLEADSTIASYDLPTHDFTSLIQFYAVRDTVRLIRWRFRVG